MEFISVILAAGEGTRMKSKRSKVLHKAAGLPLLEWVMRAVSAVETKKSVIVCGSAIEDVKAIVGKRGVCVEQKERLGSGHAVMCAREQLEGFDGYTLIVAGDMPLLQGRTVQNLCATAVDGKYDCMMLTADMQAGTQYGYGRIIRDGNGNVTAIVEEKDANEAQREITEVNASCYCVKNKVLLDCLGRIQPQNAQGEYYITDIIEMINRDGGKVGAYIADSEWESFGVNSRIDLGQVESILRGLIIGQHMNNGVTFVDMHSAYIDADTIIGMDTVIYPGVVLEKGCDIGEDVVLYPGSRISGSSIGNGTVVQNSVVVSTVVGENCEIGPYAYLRPNTEVGNNCRVGDFVEVKNSSIGDRTKVSHLTYIGDADVGRDINVGCGVVFVNYDGKVKHRSTVGDGAFIGCNTNLVSPVNVGNDAYIAAATTITKDVPDNAFVIGRSRQEVKQNWKDKRKD